MRKKPIGIYLHIPFCKSKCAYCDFLSGPATDEVKEQYKIAVLNQIKAYSFISKLYEVKTIYFGGGTPTSLQAEDIVEILSKVYEVFDCGDLKTRGELEITIEANPGTVNQEKLLAYRMAGINRISFGLQSSDNKELQLLGRIHTYEQFEENYMLARKCGFDNISVDIMSGLPNQTIEAYKSTLDKVVKLNPEHISAYSLIIEEGTPFYQAYHGGEGLPSEIEDRKMYHLTKQVLKMASYDRYEISNYAKKGYQSRHNSSYWKGTDYLGLGLGASSLLRSVRFHNEENMQQYICDFLKTDGALEYQDSTVLMEQNQRENFLALLKERKAKEVEVLDEKARMEEFMFLGLRMMEGIKVDQFEQTFQKSFSAIYGEVVEDLKEKGMLCESGNTIALTEYGIDVSNYVFEQFIFD